MIIGDHRSDGVAPRGPLHSEEDTQSGLGRAATLDEPDRLVEIDVLAHCQVERRVCIETRTYERLGPPPEHSDPFRVLHVDWDLFEQTFHT